MKRIGNQNDFLRDFLGALLLICFGDIFLTSFCSRFCLTAVYIVAIQYFTRMGGKISVKLVKRENNKNEEYSANSLVYKVSKKVG